MKTTAVASLLAIAATSAIAATPTLPQCAQVCFVRAIGLTNCDLTDYYCQCTSGAKKIQPSVEQCLCANEGSQEGCSAAEMLQVQKVSNEICSSALAAKSETYTAVTGNACAAKTGGAGTATGVASSSATATAATTGGASAGSTSASASSSSSAGAAAPTKMPMGLEGAAFGLAGLIMAAL